MPIGTLYSGVKKNVKKILPGPVFYIIVVVQYQSCNFSGVLLSFIHELKYRFNTVKIISLEIWNIDWEFWEIQGNLVSWIGVNTEYFMLYLLRMLTSFLIKNKIFTLFNNTF